MKKLFFTVLSVFLLLAGFSGCLKPENTVTGAETTSENTEKTYVSKSDTFSDLDYETDYGESGSVQIQLQGDSAEAGSDSVKISGSAVSVTEEGTYILSGSLDDGMIIIDAPDTAKVRLVLSGVNINCETSAALYILSADKVFVTLADGSENTLSNGGTFTAIDDNSIDGAVFSKQDLTLNGTGSLSVISPAGHGVVCKDDLVITGGTYDVTSASHGLDVNDSVCITGDVSLTIDAGKDGIHSENNDDDSLGLVYIFGGVIAVESEGDGISAGASMQIEDGVFQILAGGGSENGSKENSGFYGGFMGRTPGRSSQSSEAQTDQTSMKGIKSAGAMMISRGDFSIDSADDAVHSNASITVAGGVFEIATGDDAFHADDTLTVTDGQINISESYEGLEALHLDIQGGDIALVASDDGLNAAGGTDFSGMTGGRDGMFGGPGGGMSSNSDGSITISGGTLSVTASGDGIDANGSVEISGGMIAIVGPAQGDTATLDYDTSAVITGGTFIGTGAAGMARTFSDSEQGVIAVSVGSQAAGTSVTVADSKGNVLLTHEPDLSFSLIIFSSPDLTAGETYVVTVGTNVVRTQAK